MLATRSSVQSVFLAFLRLGCMSFGGPVAHLGYFRTEFVERRQWLDEPAYADIVALCQFLPGPASSQVGVSIGLLRAGLPGGFAAWLGFSGPSAAAMIAFAYGVGAIGDLQHAAWLHGLKIVAVAVVANAVWGMARNLCARPAARQHGGRRRADRAAGSILARPGRARSLAGGLIGWRLLDAPPAKRRPRRRQVLARARRRFAGRVLRACWSACPSSRPPSGATPLALFDRFYRAGSLVFGGGHVVLPLLQQSVVPPGWIGNDGFLAGYGAAQAVPGPLFTFAAYLGAAMTPAAEWRRPAGCCAWPPSTCRRSCC